jgi:hypothetical protein
MTTNQLSVKIQDALGAVGFDAAVGADGSQRFLNGVGRSTARVEAVDEGSLVRVSTFTSAGGGRSTNKEYPALMLEKHSDDALMLFFQTVIAFS